MNDPDEHWPDDGTTLETECEHCGEVRPCQNLSDPYTAEVNPEDDNPSSWWCRPCWRQRLYDT